MDASVRIPMPPKGDSADTVRRPRSTCFGRVQETHCQRTADVVAAIAADATARAVATAIACARSSLSGCESFCSRGSRCGGGTVMLGATAAAVLPIPRPPLCPAVAGVAAAAVADAVAVAIAASTVVAATAAVVATRSANSLRQSKLCERQCILRWIQPPARLPNIVRFKRGSERPPTMCAVRSRWPSKTGVVRQYGSQGGVPSVRIWRCIRGKSFSSIGTRFGNVPNGRTEGVYPQCACEGVYRQYGCRLVCVPSVRIWDARCVPSARMCLLSVPSGRVRSQNGCGPPVRSAKGVPSVLTRME